MNPRRQARELALQCLHQWDQRESEEGVSLAQELIAKSADRGEVTEYAQVLLSAYWDNASSLDDRIDSAADNWSIRRMAVVDRTVLRLATAEIVHIPETPPRVSIDEAIELAKKYSTEKSGAFVNGILDRVLTDWEKNNGAG